MSEETLSIINKILAEVAEATENEIEELRIINSTLVENKTVSTVKVSSSIFLIDKTKN